MGRMEITYFITTISAIVDTFLEIDNTKVFIKAVSETGYAFLAGTFYAVVIGVPTGILMGKNRIIDELLLPWVNMFLSAPLTALVPVLKIKT